MAKLYYSLILLLYGYTVCQVVNNIRLVNHIDYVIDVVTATVQEVEHREWCNLKLPDLAFDIDETIFDKEVKGHVKYINGFAVAIQHVDLQQTTVQQVWSFNNTDQTATVSVRGTLRMHNVAIGYDVTADLADGSHRYTAKHVHPLVSFAFSIDRNIHREDFTVNVVGTVPRSTNPIIFMPTDNTTDVLASLFDATTTAVGVNAWGPDVFQPITHDLVTKKIEFPTLCYNCAV